MMTMRTSFRCQIGLTEEVVNLGDFAFLHERRGAHFTLGEKTYEIEASDVAYLMRLTDNDLRRLGVVRFSEISEGLLRVDRVQLAEWAV